MRSARSLQCVPGLRNNWKQFALLVVVNAFVGAMIGAERVLVPMLGAREFHLTANTALLSFVASFGVVKAIANLVAGHLGDRVGRKKILVAGWLFGLPVPILLYFAPSWAWVVAANLFLGANQGLSWSMTVVMKVDLVGTPRRGFAMGLNEAAGYLSVAGAAFASGHLAALYGDRGALLGIGLGSAILGLFISLLFVRETRHFAEGTLAPAARLPFREVLTRTSWTDRSLFAVCQAGMVNNLNDGMVWGLFPIYFASHGLSLPSITFLAGVYPIVWGCSQLATGALSDVWGRKRLIVAGMILQGIAILAVAVSEGYNAWLAASVGLGLGTAMVYPSLLAAVGDLSDPSWRSSAVGVYRLWRDLGYAVGALLSGVIADLAGIVWAIAAVGTLTCLSGVLAANTMRSVPIDRQPASGGHEQVDRR